VNPHISKIDELAERVRRGAIGQGEVWQFADVVICRKAPPPSRGFYPDPRYVETEFVGELSWLFLKLVARTSAVLGDAKRRNDQRYGPLRPSAEPTVRRRVHADVPENTLGSFTV